MRPLVKRMISATLFYGILAAVWVGLVWLFWQQIWLPERFSFSFTDVELFAHLTWVPWVDMGAWLGPEPVTYEVGDLRWLGLLCGLPVLVLFCRWSLTDLPLPQHVFNIMLRALVVVALIDVQRTDFASYVSTIFVVDVSESVPDEVLEQAHAHVQEVYDQRGPNADMRVVTFSKRPRMLPIGAGGQVPLFTRHPESELDGTELAATEEEGGRLRADSVNQHTNIQDALRYAYSLFPADHVKRIVLISDGNQTEGDLLGEAYNARTYGVRLYAKHFPFEPRPEVMIRSLSIRDRDALRVGKPFEIELELFSTYATEARFNVWQGEFKEAHNSKTVEVPQGESFLTFVSEPFNPGPVLYRIEMTPQGPDHYAGNNVFRERLIIEGKPRILYVEGNPRSAHFLQRALEGFGESTGQNFIVEVRPPGGLPTTMEDILGFDAVILSDTPMQATGGRTNVSAQNMKILDDYVRRHGGGFIAIGGEQAFGLGGYTGTPIERMLPVSFDADMKRDHPSLALALLIDKSGSMEGMKMELAKDAAKAVVEVLGKDDRIMVIGFDDRPSAYVPLTRATNRTQILDRISRIRAGGGTVIQSALEMAYLELVVAPARIKHVILMTDGIAPYGSISDLVRQMNNDLITVSTVGVGSDADMVLLNMIANYGKGRSYFTNDWYSVPRIFLQETSLVTQNAIVEEPFVPRVAKSHAMVSGFSGAPDLLGYVTTKRKDGAEVLLVNGRHNDPILATWRWGTGRTTVFTSDAKNRWASGWVASRTFFPRFWAQVVRETMRRKDQTFFDLSATLQHGRGHITVDAIDVNDNFINGLHSEVKVTPPESEPFVVTLAQTAPGLYEGSFELSTFGPYYLEAVHREMNAGQIGPQVAESRGTLSYPYPAEYFYLTPNVELIDNAVAVTGGLTDPEVALLFDPEDSKVKTFVPMWPYFLWVALFLMILDVLFRRVRFYGRTHVAWSRVAG